MNSFLFKLKFLYKNIKILMPFVFYSCSSYSTLDSNTTDVLRSSVSCPISATESVVYPICSYYLNEGQICSINLNQVRPTQFNIGEQYVNKNVEKYFNNTIENQELYCKRPLNIVIGPSFEKGYFLTDGHHRMKAIEIYKTQYNKEYILLFKIEKNYYVNNYVKNKNEFWNDMEKNNFVYLSDKGTRKTPDELPKKISELANDPYRSLLGYIADDGLNFCFDKKSKSYGNFAEFKWGDYFRTFQEITGEYNDNSNYCDFRRKITNINGFGNLCKLDAAKNLPGFTLETLEVNDKKVINCN